MPLNMKAALCMNKGFGLVELMVAVFVLSIGLLGIAGLQITGIKSNHAALIHTQSAQLAYDLADRMRANMPATLAGHYLATAAPGEGYNCTDDFTDTDSVGICSPEEMALADLDWVFSLAANTMPFVAAAITCKTPLGVVVNADTGVDDCLAGYTHIINITWNEQTQDSGLVNKSTTIEFQP